MAYPVIIDNDSLAHLAYIDAKYPIIDRLKVIFSAIHVPDEILSEFEFDHKFNPERQKIIAEIYNPGKFFKKCSSFDLISKAFLQTVRGIDIGEAAAVAQYQKIRSKYIISEDIKFSKKISKIDPTIRILKLKHVFVMLDLHGLIDNWAACLYLLYQRRPFTSNELRDAYASVGEIYGTRIDKKILSQKSGFKNLGISVKRDK